jgi:ribosomal protein L39E
MSRNKSHGKKLKLASAKKKARGAPRWADIKKFGLGKARFRSIQRFRRRHWRKRGKLKV